MKSVIAMMLGLLALSAVSYADEGTLVALNDSLAIAKSEINYVNSGRYAFVMSGTVRQICNELKADLEKVASTNTSQVTKDLASLAISRINGEISDSNRWENYSLQTYAKVISEISAPVELALRYSSAACK